MKKEELKKIISLHGLWLAGKVGGVRADLRRANLSEANLRRADLREANLREANLCGANLSGADLRWANLSGANLCGANLSGADLRWANLSGADLCGANLSGADLRRADLSQVKAILLAREWLNLFETDELGVIVYRAQQGENTHPAGWNFEPGAFLTEVPNPDRCTLCACGVAFATLAWVRKNYPGQAIWKCRIRWMDLADVVVPYGTDGKARCARLELLEVVS